MLVYKITGSIVYKYSLLSACCTIRREYAGTVHGTRMHAWNTPVPRMEYACTTHGIHYMQVSGIMQWFMHEIVNFNIDTGNFLSYISGVIYNKGLN